MSRSKTRKKQSKRKDDGPIRHEVVDRKSLPQHGKLAAFAEMARQTRGGTIQSALALTAGSAISFIAKDGEALIPGGRSETLAAFSDQAKLWGPYQPLAEEVARGRLDGFEMPYEDSVWVAPCWPDGKSIVRFPAQGLIVFRYMAHQHYGYESERDFAIDLRKSMVVAKTVPGALALGRSRGIEGPPIHVAVSARQFNAHLRFVARTEAEAELMRAYLARLLPDATIRIDSNPYKIFFGQMWRYDFLDCMKNFHRLNPVRQRGVWMMFAAMLTGLLLAGFEMCGYIALGVSGWFCLAFVLIFLLSSKRLCEGSVYPDEPNAEIHPNDAHLMDRRQVTPV